VHIRRGHGWVVALPLLALAACGGSPVATPHLQGSRITVLGSWSGAEQQAFEAVLARFTRQTGITISYAGAPRRMADEIALRIAQGRLPDVALLPQPGLLRAQAAAGRLVPLSATTEQVVDTNYPARWVDLASYDGRVFGVWFKAAHKSLVWYSVATFERLGFVPPRDLIGLDGLAGRITTAGVPAFAVSGGDAWTLTDWFENLYLELAGPSKYDDLASHRLTWTDPSVVSTLTAMARLLAPARLPGGPDVAAATSFEDAVRLVFRPQPSAAMLLEGDFVAGVIDRRTSSVLGAEADAFRFPTGPGDAVGTAMVGGGDVAVMFRRTPAADALLRYLSSPAAAEVWARRGGFLSPNPGLDLSAYRDDLTRRAARDLLDAGNDFHFDLSDLQPSAFGGREAGGLRAELRRFLVERDATATATRLEAEASRAFASTAPPGSR
jgi:ABC-type glycerol-3-phosphate transport system substrate-binding protein